MSQHAWKMYGTIEACGTCGVCRRADGGNKPCPGTPPIVTARTIPGVPPGDSFILPCATCAECSRLAARIQELEKLAAEACGIAEKLNEAIIEPGNTEVAHAISDIRAALSKKETP